MSEQGDRRAVGTLIWGFAASHVVHVGTRWKIFDRIGDTERDGAELARELDLPVPSLTRLLRAAAALGLLAEVAPGRFRLTRRGALLRADRSDSLYAFARMLTSSLNTAAWGRLDESVRTGDTAFEDIFGTDFFSQLGTDPELAALFRSGMASATAGVAPELATACDFGRFDTIVDVGGGSGTLLATILAAHPGVRGVLFDTAEGVAGAADVLGPVADRCTIVEGDFFHKVPTGGDAYLLKTIVHDWDDAPATVILTNCRQAIPDHGRLLIADRVLPEAVDPAGSPLPYLMDLHMLVNLGGRERTLADLEQLCARTGFRVVDVHTPPGLDFAIVEAAPALS
jgi:O-methyltransferase/methyltransferase family protein